MVSMCVFNNSLLVSRKIYDRSPDNNSGAKNKMTEGVSQYAV